MIEKPFIDSGHCSANEHKDCLVYLENWLYLQKYIFLPHWI